MTGIVPPKVHLRVRVLPPADIEHPPETPSFLLNLEHELTFHAVWNLISRRHERDYKRPNDWIFKKIQDAYGADISLGDTVGDVFAGEAREKCIINVLQIQSHREDTVPEGSHLQPPRPLRTPAQHAEVLRLRNQETRYGTTVDQLNPDHPVESGERELGPEEQRRDGEGFRIPKIPTKVRAGFVEDRPEVASIVIADSQESVDYLSQQTEPEKDVPRVGSPSDLLQPLAKSPQITTTRRTPSIVRDSPRATSQEPQSLVDDTTDITARDPIQDDGDLPNQRLSSIPQPITPNQALENLKQRRLNRQENPDMAERPDGSKSQATPASQLSSSGKGSRAQNFARSWNEKENDILLTALAEGLDARTTYQRYFAQRTWESVRKKIRIFQGTHSAHIAARAQTLAIKASEAAGKAQAANVGKTNEAADETAVLTSSNPPTQATSNSQKTPRMRKRVSGSQVAVTPLSSIWGPDDDKLFARAIREGQDWTTLHNRHYPTRSEESFKRHFAEMRSRVELEDAAAFSEKRVRELSSQGLHPSGSNQKFKEYEDDLLLAARLEKAEMKRVAKDYFPLRAYDQVRTRATTLYQNAYRAASKQHTRSGGRTSSQGSLRSLQSSPSGNAGPSVDQILAQLDPVVRDRVNRKRAQIRQDGDRFSEERSREFTLSQKIANDKKRTKDYKDRTQKSQEWLTRLEEDRRKDDDIQARRLAEDIRNEEVYREKYAAWNKQREIDEAAGRPIQSSPKRPLGSRIGTEIATTEPLKKPVYPSPAQTSTVSHDNSVDKARTQGASKLLSEELERDTLKRRPSATVEVQIPVYKKQKLGAASTSQEPVGTSQHAVEPTPSKPKRNRISASPFKMIMASQKGDRARFAASQPVGKTSSKSRPNVHDNCMSSPTFPKRSNAQSFLKKTRQTRLSFATSSGQPPSARSVRSGGLPALTSTSYSKVPDCEIISSDDSSSYSDSDINDEDLTELADRSSQVFRSSPPRDVPDHTEDVVTARADAIHTAAELPGYEDVDRDVVMSQSNGNFLNGDRAATPMVNSMTSTQGHEQGSTLLSGAEPAKEDAEAVDIINQSITLKQSSSTDPSKNSSLATNGSPSQAQSEQGKPFPPKDPYKVRPLDFVEQESGQTEDGQSRKPSLQDELRGYSRYMGHVSQIIDGVKAGNIRLTASPGDGGTTDAGHDSDDAESVMEVLAEEGASDRRWDHRDGAQEPPRVVSSLALEMDEPSRTLRGDTLPDMEQLSAGTAADLIERNETGSMHRDRSIPRSSTPNINSHPPSGELVVQSDNDVEEISPDDIYRSAESDDDDGYGSAEDYMDMDDARDFGQTNETYFQGDDHAPKRQSNEYSPQLPNGHTAPRQFLTEEQRHRALAGPPGLSREEQHSHSAAAAAAATTPKRTFSSAYPRLDIHEPATQDLLPPFPSSGKARTVSTASSSDHLPARSSAPRDEEVRATSPHITHHPVFSSSPTLHVKTNSSLLGSSSKSLMPPPQVPTLAQSATTSTPAKSNGPSNTKTKEIKARDREKEKEKRKAALLQANRRDSGGSNGGSWRDQLLSKRASFSGNGSGPSAGAASAATSASASFGGGGGKKKVGKSKGKAEKKKKAAGKRASFGGVGKSGGKESRDGRRRFSK